MTMDRRRPDAASLREFFQTQWTHLTGLLQENAARRAHKQHLHTQETEALESLVEGTQPRIRLIGDYRQRLRSGIRAVLDHVDTLVSQLPAPLAVSKQVFFHDPRVNAFFVNKDAIGAIFSRSPELQRFFEQPENAALDQAHAIMFLSRREKKTLGVAMMGDMLTKDVPQTTVSFTNHAILQPRASAAEVIVALREFLFESFVEYANYRLTCLAAGVGTCKHCESQGSQGDSIRSPDDYLNVLCSMLEHPDQLLHLEVSTLRIDRLGTLVEADTKRPVHDLTLYEIAVGRHAHEVVALVSYPRDEMQTRASLLREAEILLG